MDESENNESLTQHEQAALAHQRLLEAVAKRYNEATPAERKLMEANLGKAKARAVSSVRGLRTMFPGLGRLKVTKEGANS